MEAADEDDTEEEECDNNDDDADPIATLAPPLPITLFEADCDASVAFRNSAAVESQMRRSSAASVENDGSRTLSRRQRSSSILASAKSPIDMRA